LGYLQLGNNPVDGNSNLRLVPEKRHFRKSGKSCGLALSASVSIRDKSPSHSLTTDSEGISWQVGRFVLGGVAVYPTLPGEKQTMEMTEYGKHGKP
jgi:hypothetical protein